MQLLFIRKLCWAQLRSDLIYFKLIFDVILEIFKAEIMKNVKGYSLLGERYFCPVFHAEKDDTNSLGIF